MESFESQLVNIFKESQKVKLGFWEKQTVGFKVMASIFGNWAAAGLLVPQKAIAIAGLALLLTGSGSVWAMEQALPGDTLYGAKIAMHQAVGVMTQASPEARANWAIKEINRIIREIEKLEQGGELGEGVEIEANESVQLQLNNFYKAKEQVVVKKGAEAGEKLEEKLTNQVTGLVRWSHEEVEDDDKEASGEAEIRQEVEVETETETEAEVKNEERSDSSEDEDESENKDEDNRDEDKDNQVNGETSLKLKLEW